MKLGELFVDLEVNSGSAFNTLSNFAFQFNNLSALAEKFTKTITNGIAKPAFKNTELVHELKLIAELLGESEKSIQGIRTAAGRTSRNPNLFGEMTGQLSNFTQKRLEYLIGKNKAFFEEASYFGLTNEDLRGSPLKNMEKMINVMAGINNASDRANFAKIFGFSQDSLKAWQEFFGNREALENNPWNFTDEEIKQSAKLYSNLAQLSDNVGKAAEQFGKNLTPTINTFLGVVNKWLESDKFRKFMEHPLDTTGSFFEDLYNKYYPDFLKSNKNMVALTLAGGAVHPAIGATLGTLWTGSLLGEGTTTLGLKYFGSKTENSFLTNLKDMGLKGGVWSENSKPTIRTSNIARMKQLDEILSAWAQREGVEILYTSAMGGKHKKGSGHYSGNKIDVQFFKNGKQVELPRELENTLENMGYFGGRTGAVGREKQKNGGFHHDLFIGDIESRTIGNGIGGINNTTNNRSLTINVKDDRQASNIMGSFMSGEIDSQYGLV